MDRGESSKLPALAERRVPESEYRALREAAGRADALSARVAELERALLVAENRAGKLGDPSGDLVAALLPVLDTFAHALAAARERQDYAAILVGVELVEREMTRVLGLFGLERIAAAAGQGFDPALHETLERTGALETLVGIELRIVAELRPGYRSGERILRKSIVRVTAMGS